MSAEAPYNAPKPGPTRVQTAALLGVLLLLAGGLFYGFVKRGRQAEAQFIIRGRTPIEAVAAPNNAVQPPGVGSQDEKMIATPPPALQSAVVHVAGSVAKPGLYRLSPGSRVDDAIKHSGGALPTADLDSLNLAQLVEDGQKIYVPLREVKRPDRDASDSRSPLASDSSPGSADSAKPGKFSKASSESLNLNTANAEELQRLPGVGPAMADRIISFRKENGPFTDTEQLMDVSGVGEKKFARMRPFLRVR